jgi:hypothetical protein
MNFEERREKREGGEKKSHCNYTAIQITTYATPLVAPPL